MSTDRPPAKLISMTTFASGVVSRWASSWTSSSSTHASTTAASPAVAVSQDTRRCNSVLTFLAAVTGTYIDAIRNDASRTIMGGRQENWFYRQLKESKERGATWRVVGNQLIFSHLVSNADGAMSTDNWNVSTRAPEETGVVPGDRGLG